MASITGIGIGLRMELSDALLERDPADVDWLEVHPENYMHRGGRYRTLLRKAGERWPIVTHGLTMGFGCTTPHDREYLDSLARFLRDVGTPWHSDHLCFPGTEGAFVHDLLPLPFNEAAVETVVARMEEARGTIDLELAVENVSFYAPSDLDETDEPGFINEVLGRTGAKLLLDVNNVYVNSRNFGFDPRAWIDRIDPDHVVQIHVAGHHVRKDGFRIDTHAEPVCDDVYDLLAHTVQRMGPKPILLERDGNFPDFEEILAEVRQLRAIVDAATARPSASATTIAPEVAQ